MRDTIDIAREAWLDTYGLGKDHNIFVEALNRFAELVRADEQANAFRAGVLYAAKKYAEVSQDMFTGNDVSMFLEMEEAELSDEDIAAIRARV